MGRQDKKRQRKEKKKKKIKEVKKRSISEKYCNSLPKFVLNDNIKIKSSDNIGWSRFSKMRDAHKVAVKALDYFPGDKTLKRLLKYGINKIKTKSEIFHLSLILSKTIQKECSDPPFFIPIVSFSGIYPYISIFTLDKKISTDEDKNKNISTDNGIGYYLADVDDSKLYLSRHAAERFYNRTVDFLGIRNIISEQSIFIKISEYMEYALDESGESVIAVLHDKIMGYFPISKSDKGHMAKTYLIPVMRGTPQFCDIDIEESKEMPQKVFEDNPMIFTYDLKELTRLFYAAEFAEAEKAGSDNRPETHIGEEQAAQEADRT